MSEPRHYLKDRIVDRIALDSDVIKAYYKLQKEEDFANYSRRWSDEYWGLRRTIEIEKKGGFL